MGSDKGFRKHLRGKTAVVTGGGGSIGSSVSVRLARHGANIVVAQRSVESAKEVVKRVRELGMEGMYVHTNLNSEGDITSLVDDTVERFESIDIIVNNAANRKTERAEMMDVEMWKDVLATNLTGSFVLAQKAFPYLQETDYGRIINIGAVLSHLPLPGAVAYVSSKTGLEGLTRSLAVEWSEYSITVNTVHPGPIYNRHWADEDTANRSTWPPEERYEDVPPSFDESAPTLVGRMGRPSDIAAFVSFLASPESGFVTGTVLRCDGGSSLSREKPP